ncbi:MAG: YaiI/YqxD family protein [Planctomycetaceae bacterium]
MQIWIDADACPQDCKELLFKAAQKRQVLVTLVSNSSLYIPRSPYINQVVVRDGMNIADRKIVELLSPGDLVITADIPLAADVVAKGAEALNPRGELYTNANIGERLAMRNLYDEMRGSGQVMRGPQGFTAKNRQDFANQLDRWLTKAQREQAAKSPPSPPAEESGSSET